LQVGGSDEDNAASLTGVWNGRFFYPRIAPPVSFVATLIETASRLTGATHEPAERRRSGTACATVIGHRDGSSVMFVKTYDDPKLRPIDYRGTLNGDATEIDGVWQIRGNWSGTFLMIRAPRKGVAVTRKIAERV
jgi:hypothetical protein